jgi:tryptophan synthase alpha chain
LKKLVSYITSSYPSSNFTIDLGLSLKENGTDIIELGVPFSDPVADGPVIEQASLEALKSGVKLKDVLEVAKNISNSVNTYLMGYLNPFYKYGLDNLTTYAKQINLKGFIIPDLPFEEALLYKNNFTNNNLDLVDFIAPTDTLQRIQQILTSDSKGFIYLVAFTGITGANKNENLTPIIENIKSVTKKNIFVGFGVNEKTAKEKSKNVDGVIVGSAYVKILLDNSLTQTQKIKNISNLSKIIKEEINNF